MGSSASKPETVYHGETPVRFSNSLLATLESSTESNSTRDKTLELHIQSRVAAELKRLEERESEIVAGLDQKLLEGSSSQDQATLNSLDRNKVKAEIDALKQRLQELPKVRELEGELKTARDAVVKCLRNNEARPLDCYEEVEAFKLQTRKLEKAFVVRTVGREY